MSIGRKFLAAAAMVVLGTASSAWATTVSIDFTGGSSGTYGADNSRTFTSGGVTVTAKAWSMATASETTTRTQVFLGHFSSGLGVSNDAETNNQTTYYGNNEHTVDNKTKFDFVEMAFSSQVKILSVTVVPFTVSSSTDTDISYNFGSWSGSRSNASGGGSTTTYSWALGSQSLTSTFNVWASLAIGAGTDYDGFKISGITFDYVAPVSAVPVPSAALLGLGLLGGLGAVGAWRRRRRVDLSV